jgi:hypothetical protein
MVDHRHTGSLEVTSEKQGQPSPELAPALAPFDSKVIIHEARD